MKKKSYSLRERNFAQTKLGLMNAFLKRLKSHSFENISIRDVCRDADVAEKTFFNYFPEKLDVITYYMQLNGVKNIFEAVKAVPEGKYLELIQFVFCRMGKEFDRDNVIYQIIAAFIVQGEKPKKMEISGIEKQMAFPDCEGIEKVEVIRFHDWVRKCVKAACKNGELPLKTNINDVVVSLITILGGTLLAMRVEKIKDWEYHYMRQLRDLWKSLGVSNKMSK